MPSTAPQAAYGTTAMAVEIKKLLKHPIILEKGILAMGGHREGIIAFGKNPGETKKLTNQRITIL
jgi:hypothetical protein